MPPSIIRNMARRLRLAVKNNTITNTGAVSGSDGLDAVTLSQQNELEIITGTARWYAPANITITKTNARLRLASDGTTTVVVNVDGTSVKTINITASSLSSTDNTNFSMTEGQYLTVDLTSVGSNPGSDLNVQFIYNFD